MRVYWICWLFSALFRGFPYLLKNHHFKFRFNLEKKILKPIPCKFQSKTLVCSFHVICKFSFDAYARPWVLFSFLPLSLRFLCIETFLATDVSDHDLFKMATASVKRFHTTIMHVIFESPQRYFYKSLTT